MNEELFKESEELLAMHHPLIMKARKISLDQKWLEKEINELVESAFYHRQQRIRKQIKALPPQNQEQELVSR